MASQTIYSRAFRSSFHPAESLIEQLILKEPMEELEAYSIPMNVYNKSNSEIKTSEPIFDITNKEEKEDEKEIWLTTKKAAAKIGVSPNALRIMVHRGKLKRYKLGSHNRYDPDDLKALPIIKES